MKELINKYVWIVDTLSRYDRLSRAEINELWMRSAYGDGTPMPERTFYYYRRGIEENFHIDILCDKAGKYYIDPGQTEQSGHQLASRILRGQFGHEGLGHPDRTGFGRRRAVCP
jgi:hypothetical protein